MANTKQNIKSKIEYYIWGTPIGKTAIDEDIIKINGESFQTDLNKARQIIKIISKRGLFYNLRIQTINTNKPFNFVKEVIS